MQFIHYSREPLFRVEDRSQELIELENLGAKPHGLWFSVGNAWKVFFQASEHWRKDPQALDCETEIVFSHGERCCYVRNVVELDALTTEYSKISDRTNNLPSSRRRPPLIDWPRFALDFDAIVIDPFISERSIQDHWYRSWDVASGCVWRARSVAQVRPIKFTARLENDSL